MSFTRIVDMTFVNGGYLMSEMFNAMDVGNQRNVTMAAYGESVDGIYPSTVPSGLDFMCFGTELMTQ